MSDPGKPASRILALDVGNRRIGVALSDPLGYTAQPLLTIYHSTLKADLKSIARLIRRYDVATVLIGLPLHASGGRQPPVAEDRGLYRGPQGPPRSLSLTCS